MVKIELHGPRHLVTINSMIDSGAVEDMLEREVCNNQGKDDESRKPKGH